MKLSLESVNWESALGDHIVEEVWTVFKEKLQAVIDANVPEGRRGPWRRKPWMTGRSSDF
jgi:hypothetical protein